jgi:hypothetical protein
LYDLEKDPGEVVDLAETMSDKVEESEVVWEEYMKEAGVVWGMPIKIVSLERDGMEKEGYVAGDALGQTISWMKVGAGQAPGKNEGITEGWNDDPPARTLTSTLFGWKLRTGANLEQ